MKTRLVEIALLIVAVAFSVTMYIAVGRMNKFIRETNERITNLERRIEK